MNFPFLHLQERGRKSRAWRQPLHCLQRPHQSAPQVLSSKAQKPNTVATKAWKDHQLIREHPVEEPRTITFCIYPRGNPQNAISPGAGSSPA